MKRFDLTWVDWTLIWFGLFLLFHMPDLIEMRRHDEQYDAIRASIGGRP